MATVDQLRPIYIERFSDALNWWLGQENRVGRMQLLADEIGVDLGTVRNWVYRETFPNGVQLLSVFDYCQGVEERTRKGISATFQQRTVAAEERLRAVGGLVNELQAIIGGQVIPIKGRAS